MKVASNCCRRRSSRKQNVFCFLKYSHTSFSAFCAVCAVWVSLGSALLAFGPCGIPIPLMSWKSLADLVVPIVSLVLFAYFGPTVTWRYAFVLVCAGWHGIREGSFDVVLEVGSEGSIAVLSVQVGGVTINGRKASASTYVKIKYGV